MDLTSYYTFKDFYDAVPCPGERKYRTDVENPGKEETQKVAKQGSIKSLITALINIRKSNTTKLSEEKIKYVIFHAAGNPFDLNGGLFGYYKKVFGATLLLSPFYGHKWDGTATGNLGDERLFIKRHTDDTKTLDEYYRVYLSQKEGYDKIKNRLDNSPLKLCNLKKYPTTLTGVLANGYFIVELDELFHTLSTKYGVPADCDIPITTITDPILHTV